MQLIRNLASASEGTTWLKTGGRGAVTAGRMLVIPSCSLTITPCLHLVSFTLPYTVFTLGVVLCGLCVTQAFTVTFHTRQNPVRVLDDVIAFKLCYGICTIVFQSIYSIIV